LKKIKSNYTHNVGGGGGGGGGGGVVLKKKAIIMGGGGVNHSQTKREIDLN